MWHGSGGRYVVAADIVGIDILLSYLVDDGIVRIEFVGVTNLC